MSQKIEDYALIGDCTTAALVGAKGYFADYIFKSETGTTLTPADTVIENDGLVELTNNIKQKYKSLITSGTGASTSFAIAEEVIAELYG